MSRRTATTTDSTISVRIRARRDELRLTQRELGRRSKFEAADIWKYEHARSTPSLSSVMRLADALRVSIDWLLTGRESQYARRSTTPSAAD